MISSKLEIISSFQESLWINIDLINKESLIIGCIYRSPSSDDVNNDYLFELMKHFTRNTSNQVLLLGDFNYPLIDWESSVALTGIKGKEHKFIEVLRDCFLFQKCTEPTRLRFNNKPSLLDLVLVNNIDSVEDIQYESPLGKSDHRVLQFELNCIVKKVKYTKLKYYYNKANYEAINNSLLGIDWSIILGSDDVDEQWNAFKNCIDKEIATHVPTKLIKSDSVKRIPLDDQQRKLIKEKHKLYEKY